MVEIRFFPLDINYKVKEEKSYVYLYGRTEEGEQICVVDKFEPYFYVESKGDTTLLKKEIENLSVEFKGKEVKVTRTEEIEKNFNNKPIKLLKIYTNITEGRNKLREKINELGLECFEYDFSYIFQYLRDKRITPMTLVKVRGENVNEKSKVPLISAEQIESDSSWNVKDLNILSFDIETYAKEKAILPDKNPILMISFYGKIKREENEDKPFQKVITWKKFKTDLDYIEFVDNEEELIKSFKKIIEEYKPDILTGYFSDGFDLPYIKKRAEIHNIKLNVGLDYSNLFFNKRNEYGKITGIAHIDIFKFIRNVIGRGMKTESLSLDAVSSELLGSNKHKVDLNNLADTWDSISEVEIEQESKELEEFCEYNLQDSYLTYELCIKLMPSIIELVKLIGLPPFDINRMSFSKLVENYILKKGKEINLLATNKPDHREIEWRREKTYKGGFVYEPKPGIYENIVVFDFRSLYPTIIASHNIGRDTLNCDCCKDSEKVPGKDYWFCKKERSFFSNIVEDLISTRLRIKEMIKEKRIKNEDTALLDARSYGLKIMANAFYGYMGFFAARWYSLECVQSITSYARDYITKTMDKAKEKGFDVIYGDTDSLMIKLNDKTKEEALEFMKEINSKLPEFMELEFEGLYPRGIFVSVKSGNYGAKKKYALFDGEKLQVTGFETVRRNWSKIAKETQDNVLQIILKENDVEKALTYVNNTVEKIKKGEVKLSKVIIKTQLTKPIEQYESIGPHVAVAKRMAELGYDIVPGIVISFVVAKGSGLIRERAKLIEELKEGEYDSEYYINHQIIPAVNSIFAVLGYKEEDIVKGNQKGLSDFF